MSTKKPIPIFKLLIHYTCLAPVIVAFGLNLFYPPRPHAEDPFPPLIFFFLVFTACLTFPVLGFLDRKFLNMEVLQKNFRKGIDSAVVSLKSGIMGGATVVAFSAFLGATNYLIDREQSRLFVFLGIWSIQYMMVLYWVKRGYEDLNRLTRLQRKKKPRRRKRSKKKRSRSGKGPHSDANH